METKPATADTHTTVEADAKAEAWAGPRFLLVLNKLRALTIVTGRFAEIVLAQAPLPEGLLVDAMATPNRKLRALFLSIRGDLIGGMQLSDSMRRHHKFFPAYYADMVRTGEQTGKLYQCLNELESSLIAEAATQGHARFHVLYALTIILVAFAFAGGAAHYLLSQLMDEAHGFGFDETSITSKLLLRMGEWRIDIIAPILIVAMWAALLMAGSGSATRGFSGGRLFGLFSLSMPFLRYIVVRGNLATAYNILGRLLNAGMPLSEALGSVSKSDLHPAYKAAFARMQKKVEQGFSLGEALKTASWIIPGPYRGMVALGEQSGRLPDSLSLLSDVLRREAIARTKLLVDWAAPVGIIVAGLLVFIISNATFSTITSLHIGMGQ